MHTERKSFPASGPVSLDVQNGAGSIDITATDVGTIEVEIRAASSNSRDEEGCRESRIEYDERRSVLVVHSPKQHFGRGPTLHMAISVPSRSTVRAHAGSADITGTGRFADVEATCGSGNVTFEDVDGDITARNGSGNVEVGAVSGEADLHSASGNVKVDSAGRLKAGTASGNLSIGDVRGQSSLSSASGNVDVRAIAGDTRVKVVSGDIEIGIPAGIVAELDVTSVSGNVESSLPVDDSAPVDGGRPVAVNATSVSGNVSIVPAGS